MTVMPGVRRLQTKRLGYKYAKGTRLLIQRGNCHILDRAPWRYLPDPHNQIPQAHGWGNAYRHGKRKSFQGIVPTSGNLAVTN